jgi:hypothetical protein
MLTWPVCRSCRLSALAMRMPAGSSSAASSRAAAACPSLPPPPTLCVPPSSSSLASACGCRCAAPERCGLPGLPLGAAGLPSSGCLVWRVGESPAARGPEQKPGWPAGLVQEGARAQRPGVPKMSGAEVAGSGGGSSACTPAGAPYVGRSTAARTAGVLACACVRCHPGRDSCPRYHRPRSVPSTHSALKQIPAVLHACIGQAEGSLGLARRIWWVRAAG